MKNKIKRLTAVLLAALMIFGAGQIGLDLSAAAAYTNVIPDEFTPIYNLRDLEAIGDNLSGKYILMNNINMSGYNWTAIAGDFTGILDGNCCTVSNFNLASSSYSCAGLFENNSGVIKDLNISNCHVDFLFGSADECYIGIIAASNSGDITNCSVQSDVQITQEETMTPNTPDGESHVYIGMIAGYNDGNIAWCSSSGTLDVLAQITGSNSGESFSAGILAQTHYIGGIAGRNEGVLSYDSSKTTIQSTLISGFAMYGLVGSSAAAKYSECSTYMGGIAGYIASGTVSECYNNGSMISTVTSIGKATYLSSTCYSYAGVFCGGIAGNLCDDGLISDSYNTAVLNGNNNGNNTGRVIICEGGIIGYNDQSYVENTYNNADVKHAETTYTSKYLGSIAGNNDNGSLSGCYFNTASPSVGVGKGYNSTVKFAYAARSTEETYDGFDFDNLWVFDARSNSGYPQLIDNSENISITGIKMKTMPQKLSYYQNDKLNINDGRIEITYSNGYFKRTSIGSCSVSYINMASVGMKAVELSYSDWNVTFNITVNELIVTSLSIKTPPTQTVYYVGDTFSPSGLVVNATYNSGAIKVFNGYTLGSVDMSSSGTKTVTVSYGGISTSFQITVSPVLVSKVEINTMPDKLTYYRDDVIDTAGLTLLVTYNNGNTITVSSGFNVNFDFSTAGTKTIAVTYLGNTLTYTAEVLPLYYAAFKANGTVIAAIKFYPNTTSISEPAIPQKQGYTAKWETYTLNGQDVTINAIYTPVVYTATFIAGGKTVASVPYTVETKTITEPAVPAKEGFSGSWQSYKLAIGGVTINAVYTENHATDVEITASATSVAYNETITLSAEVTPSDAANQNVVWKSSDTSVATVDENGTVTGKGKGTAIISATVTDGEGNPVLDGDGNNITDTIEITVSVNYFQNIVIFFNNIMNLIKMFFGSLF